MFNNYFKIAWRNLFKHKIFSFINIAGLAIGLCCFLLIGIYVLDEWSYDRFHEKASRIYRVNTDLTFNGSVLKLPVASDMTGSTMKKDYPEVEDYARVWQGGNKLIKHGASFLKENHVVHADSGFFRVFSFPALYGNPAVALNEPNSVVISAAKARTYFGTTDAVGKTLETNDRGKTIYKVTAVIKDMPENSQFHFDFLLSLQNVEYPWGTYLSNNFFTYLLLKPGTDYKSFDAHFREYVIRYVMPQASAVMQIKNIQDFEKGGNSLRYSLIPFTRIHLYSTDRDFELSAPGNIQYVYIFSGVALFVLIIACINFMNLTTARSSNRAREVGIRKVLGSERRNLMAQFLGESILIVLLSMAIAVLLAWLVLPYFNSIANKSMSLAVITSTPVLPWLLALPLVVGVLAGSYPAMFLSAFKPVDVLKGKLVSGRRLPWLRSGLVVFQFAMSILLIIGTIVIYQQLHYIQTKNLGFNKEQVLIIDDAYALGNNLEAFKTELSRLPSVRSSSISGYLPVASNRSDYTLSTTAVPDTKSAFNPQVWDVDEGYLATMGMKLQEGRNFAKDFSDSNSLIINESAASLLNFNQAVGKKLYTVEVDGKSKEYRIIGVVKNFHFSSLRDNIAPLCLRLGHSTGSASFRVSGKNIPELLKTIENKWKTMAPVMPFSYRFMDAAFDEMYRSEQRIGKIVLIFSVLAILVACMGLFGLANYMAEQRSREIGIRKVLGASVQGIVQLLSKEFVVLVFIAFILATPLSWYFMNRWLQDFAFRIQINPWIFGAAGLLAMLIALMTISSQAIRAAVANPAKTLKEQ